jgi:DNA polymerase-3 subunit gamma/tau
MENFIVSARKYRPATFDTVVGQLSITTTLKNAIKNNHLAQAFLFCGPRGVGKTTCARILAKTINCKNLTPNIEACDTCESCATFNTGQSLNIYELDAASNNSVDDIRNLVEQVRFPPHNGRYKIYIIDEVHMLSANAFNAFLKTLEEPPAYAIFILATTEKHKIIPTILSRCQIFDFSRIQIEDIASHLASIAQKENITADTDALHIIAQKADGALRDSLSMFDQIVSYAGNNVTYKSVIENLNILDYDYYFKITDYLLDGDISASFLIYNDILNNGFDGHNFINGLSGHFRDLMMCKDEVTLKLLEVSPSIREKYREQGKKSSSAFLITALDITNKCDMQYKTVKNQRLHVELCLLKMCGLNHPQLSSAEDVKKKLDTPIATPAVSPVYSANVSTPNPVVSSPIQAAAPIVPKIESVGAIPVEALKLIPTSQPTSNTAPREMASVFKTVSISDSLNLNKNPVKDNTPIMGEPPVSAIQKSENTFTQERFYEVWTEYAKVMQQDGKMQLYTTFTKRKPLIGDDNVIMLTIDNKVQDEELNLEKMALLEFVRTKLNNFSIQLKTEISAIEDTSNMKYTDQDKFKFLAEKNPQLMELKKNLGLDFD